MVYTLNNEQHTRRKLMTIDGSKVTTETGIPLACNVVLPGVKSDGSDVRLAHLDGTPIAREIECVGVPSTDAVMIHYPLDTVASTNSQFYVYWGNANLNEPAADSTYGREAVYDANFKAVYIMNDDPTGTVHDSTSNNVDLTQGASSMTSGDLVNTSYGKAINFDGVNDILISANNYVLNGETDFDIMAFTKPADTTGFQVIVSHWDSAAVLDRWALGMNVAEISGRVDPSDTAWHDGVTNVQASAWQTLQMNRNSNTMYFNINGVDAGGSYAHSTAVSEDNAYPLGIGSFSTGITASPFQGDIGMVAISDTFRSTNYQLTMYKNLNNPTASGTDPFYLSDGPVQHQRRVPTFIN